jgi:thimet oligopeptidase
MKRIEYTPRDFAWTRWTAEDIGGRAKQVIAEKRAALEAVKAIPTAERSFENTVYALEASEQRLTDVYRMSWLMNASPEAAVRDAAATAMEYVERELVDLEYDEAVYRAVEAYAAQGETLGEAETKLLNDRLRMYRRMGFDLPEEQRATLKNNLKRLSELSNNFSKNINEYHDAIEVTREELAGLPEDYIARLKKTDATTGEEKYLVSLDYPELNPYLENAEHAEKREELARKQLRKGGEQNMEILREVVRLRHENAQLLGYEHHGDFRTEEKMAKSSAKTFAFLHDITERLVDRVQEEVASMEAWKQRITKTPNAKLLHSDIRFAINRMTREQFGIDKESLRAYFPLEKVKTEMFAIFGELLGVRFERVPEAQTWHESVEVYQIRDTKTEEVVAYFFLDLYTREGKNGQPAVFEFVRGHRAGYRSEEYVCPSIALVMNVPAPHGDQASYISHDEIETLFHEFGHTLHETLYAGDYASQSGFGVAHDFVEAPSQMLEHWAWQPDILKRISEHRETKQPLDDATIAKILESKNFLEGYATMRQMVQSLFDMELHTGGIQKEINEEFSEMMAKYIGVPLPDEHLFAAGFGHLMGYDAGYYDYIWAKVYAVDFFSRFEQEGILSPKVGTDYREQVLAIGASRDELTIARNFLGRESNSQAFLRELGLDKR